MKCVPVYRVRLRVALVALMALMIVSGCSGGSNGPKRNCLSGAVTVDGNPVLAGRIIFSPDDKKGNSGPGATAFIVDGRYQTPRGHGVVSGPHVVDILGFDESDDSDEDDAPGASVKTIIEMDVPEEGGEYDFHF